MLVGKICLIEIVRDFFFSRDYLEVVGGIVVICVLSVNYSFFRSVVC